MHHLVHLKHIVDYNNSLQEISLLVTVKKNVTKIQKHVAKNISDAEPFVARTVVAKSASLKVLAIG